MMTGETWGFAESKKAPKSSHILALNGVQGLRHFHSLLTGSPGWKAQKGWMLDLLQESTQRLPVMMGSLPPKKDSNYLGISVVRMQGVVKAKPITYH